MTQELKPCPFCGATPFLHRGDGIVGISCGPDSACNKTGLCVAFSPEKEESAIAAWNNRAAASAPAIADRSFISPLDGRRIDPDALDAKYHAPVIADTAGTKYTQADMERYGKCYADASDKRRTEKAGAKLTDEQREALRYAITYLEVDDELSQGMAAKLRKLLDDSASSVADAAGAQTYSGFCATFFATNRRNATEQEIFDAGVRAGIVRGSPAAQLMPRITSAVMESVTNETSDEILSVLTAACGRIRAALASPAIDAAPEKSRAVALQAIQAILNKDTRWALRVQEAREFIDAALPAIDALSTPAMDAADERELFEKFMFSTGMVWDNSRDTDYDGDEQYADVETRLNWEVWQAARSAPAINPASSYAEGVKDASEAMLAIQRHRAIYQVEDADSGAWGDVDWLTYESSPETIRRIVYSEIPRPAIDAAWAKAVALYAAFDADGNLLAHSKVRQGLSDILNWEPLYRAAPTAIDEAPENLQVSRLETTSEHIARDIREGRFPQRSEPQFATGVVYPSNEFKEGYQEGHFYGYSEGMYAAKGADVAKVRLEAFERGWRAATELHASYQPEEIKDPNDVKRAEWKEKAWKWMLVSPLLTAAFQVLWKPSDPEDDGPEYCAKRDELAKAFMTVLFGEYK